SAAAAPRPIYTLSLHDALPILTVDEGLVALAQGALDTFGDQLQLNLLLLCVGTQLALFGFAHDGFVTLGPLGQLAQFIVQAIGRSEEHTSELQSRENLVCRLLL